MLKEISQGKKYKENFFSQDAISVARAILGDYLVVKKRKIILCGKIVETEAYLGKDDDASHSFAGRRTPRNEIMYKKGGLIYVYLIYGKFYCFNIVVGAEDDPQAVFIRALEPIAGIDFMKKQRGVRVKKNLTNGPGRWTQSFGIDKNFLGKSITSEEIYIVKNKNKNFKIASAKRVGVDYAQKRGNDLLRFYIKDNPFVSCK